MAPSQMAHLRDIPADVIRVSQQRRGGALILALAMTLLLTSCMKVEQGVYIDDDGSGQIEVIAAFNFDEMLSVMGEDDAGFGLFGSNNRVFCDQMARELATQEMDLPPTGRTENYRDGDFCGVKAIVDLPAGTDHSFALTNVFDRPRLEKSGDNWYFEGTLSLDELDSADLGGVSDLGDMGIDGFPAMGDLFDSMEYRVIVDLPGTAVEGDNNADDVSGGRFEWNIDILNPEGQLYASTQPGGGPGFNPMILLALLALAAGIAGLVWFFVSDKDTPTGVTGTETSPVGHGATVGGADQHWQDHMKQPAMAGAGAATATAAAGPVAATSTATLEPATVAAAPEPVFDEALGAWTLEHPEHGRFWHDPATDRWQKI